MEISLDPGTTYVAYDPQTGLNWAYATFGSTGPPTDSSGSPDVGMQDGGDTGCPQDQPRVVAQQAFDAVESGAIEGLADERARFVKESLGRDHELIYPAVREFWDAALNSP